MIEHNYILKLTAVFMAAAVGFCLLAMVYSGQLEEAWSGKAVAMEYESELFDTEQVLQIDIQMEESEWEEMLQNAIAEEYYSCDVAVNGQKFYSVAIRPKGNTSLSSIARDETTDRFSLKLEFDHYVAGQTCYGLDKLVLNNNFADATNMKEAVIYDMYQYLGADASYSNYARISVNGEYWGVYLALEAVEDSFLLRNYGTENGNLYKPEGMQAGGREGGADARPAGFVEGGQMMPEADAPGFAGETLPEVSPEDVSSGNNGMPGAERDGEGRPVGERTPPEGGFSMGGNGADLNYSDDSLDSYSTIWEGEVTKTTQADHRKVVKALQNISQGTDLETYLDIDNILKYMAVHTFSVNQDSLSGNMPHNYYLYESDGRLNILPWDYNLSFGGMTMGASSGASAMINDAIDTPFQGTHFFDKLLENQEYLSLYHGYLQQLAEEYVSGGRFDETYARIHSQIDELVKTDPTAFYSYEEYTAGAEMLYQTVRLRAKSITGQLQGEIPSTDEDQRKDISNFVDASGIDVETMGVFQGGGGEGGHSRIHAESGQKNRSEEKTQEVFADSVLEVPSEDAGSLINAHKIPPGDMGSTKDPFDTSDRLKEASSGRIKRNAVTYMICLAILAFALSAVRRYARKAKP